MDPKEKAADSAKYARKGSGPNEPKETAGGSAQNGRVKYEYHRLTKLSDLGTALLILRRLYHAYFVMLAVLFALVLGLNFMLQVLFSLFLPDVSSGRPFFFVALGLLCLILLLSFFVGGVISHGALLLRDCISYDEFPYYRRALTLDRIDEARKCRPGTKRATVDRAAQLLIMLSFDVLPGVIGLVYVFMSSTNDGVNAFFLSATLIGFGHVCLFWFAALVRDYYDKFIDFRPLWRGRKVAPVSAMRVMLANQRIDTPEEQTLEKRVLKMWKRSQTTEEKINICIQCCDFLTGPSRVLLWVKRIVGAVLLVGFVTGGIVLVAVGLLLPGFGTPFMMPPALCVARARTADTFRCGRSVLLLCVRAFDLCIGWRCGTLHHSLCAGDRPDRLARP